MLHIYAASALAVVSGANEGDTLGALDHAAPGDIYRLTSVCDGKTALPKLASIADLTAAEPHGTATFMTKGSATAHEVALAEWRDALVVVSALPLPTTEEMTLVDASAAPAPLEALFPPVPPSGFAAGTRILVAGGQFRPVESLRAGDRVMTRDNGPRPLAQTARHTLRAEGAACPVTIRAGAMKNDRDLRLSPAKNLYFYRGPGGDLPSDAMIAAESIVDDADISQRPGGWVDYHTLAFDRDEIVYAEGIAAECPAHGAQAQRRPAQGAAAMKLPNR